MHHAFRAAARAAVRAAARPALAASAAAGVALAAAAGARCLSLPSAAADGAVEFVDLDLSKVSLDHHLIHASLSGEDAVHAYSLAISRDRTQLRATARLGKGVCGHPSIIHGGALATLLDDCCGTLFLSGGFNGFTANLSINYKKPVPAGSSVVITAKVVSVVPSASNPNAVKVTIAGEIRDASSGALFTEASALFISKAVPSSGGAANRFFADLQKDKAGAAPAGASKARVHVEHAPHAIVADAPAPAAAGRSA